MNLERDAVFVFFSDHEAAGRPLQYFACTEPYGDAILNSKFVVALHLKAEVVFR